MGGGGGVAFIHPDVHGTGSGGGAVAGADAAAITDELQDPGLAFDEGDAGGSGLETTNIKVCGAEPAVFVVEAAAEQDGFIHFAVGAVVEQEPMVAQVGVGPADDLHAFITVAADVFHVQFVDPEFRGPGGGLERRRVLAFGEGDGLGFGDAVAAAVGGRPSANEVGGTRGLVGALAVADRDFAVQVIFRGDFRWRRDPVRVGGFVGGDPEQDRGTAVVQEGDVQVAEVVAQEEGVA